jgi:hypothetical protein
MATPADTDLSNQFVKTKVEPGEIRRLIDMELANDSRLVVVVKFNRADDSAEVVLVNNMTEIATPRDVIAPGEKTGAPFDLAILTDFVSHVWAQQIETSPIFGKIDSSDLTSWLEENNASHNHIYSNQNDFTSQNRGRYVPEFGDHVWLFRGREIDALNVLGHVPEINTSNERFYEIWRKPNADLSLPDILIANNFELSLIDNFLSNDAIRFELV